MNRFLVKVTVVLVLFAHATQAAEVVRTSALVASMPIQGLTLSMSPRQAFESLKAKGYRAGNLDNFDNWVDDGIEFVKGDYGSPNGLSNVTFARMEDRIVRISETWNRPRDPFDVEEYIDEMRRHFGIADDEASCQAVSATSGTCRIQDANASEEVDLAYGLQVLPGMLIRYVESKRAYSG